MASAKLDLAVLEMEKQVNLDKANHFRRMAAETDPGMAMSLSLLADRFEEAAGIAAGMLAAHGRRVG